MGLQTVRIHRSTVFLDGIDKVNALIFVPLYSIIIVVNQDCFWPAFPGHFESGCHKGVIVVVAAERLDDFGARITGMVGVRACADGFVHHVDQFQVGVMLGDGIEPGGDCRLCVRDAQVRKASSDIGCCDEGVEPEVPAVVLRPVVGGVAAFEVIGSAGSFDGAPFAFVFRGDLIPVSAEIRADCSVRGDVSEVFRGAVSERRGSCEACGKNPAMTAVWISFWYKVP